MTITLVTAYFDIATKEKHLMKRRNSSTYLKCAQDLMKQDYNMVIYTEPQFENDIVKMRAGRCNKTRIITMNFDEIPYYRYKDRIDYCLKTNKIDGIGMKNTVLYTIICWAKMEFVRMSIESNFFDTTHFGWIDFGIGYLSPNLFYEKNVLGDIPDKISLLQLNYFKKGMYSFEELMKRRMYIFAGGLITGKSTHILWFCKQFKDKCMNLLDIGHAPIDEMIFPMIVEDNENMFRFYSGKYIDIISNYKARQNNFKHIENVILDC